MRSLPRALAAVALAGLALAVPAGAAHADDGPSDSSSASGTAFTIQDKRINESSGLAASRAHPGVYWTHNDSDDGPYVYAVDGRTGRTVATVTLDGAEPRDVEAISVGPDGQVYVGDIGDNKGGTWREVWIYRFPEPERLGDTTVTATRFTVRYDDGPRDAESLMIHPVTGRAYIVSKHQDGGGLYEGPARLSPSVPNTFRRIADIGLWATDAAFSPDGTRLVVRSYFSANEYRWQNGKPVEIGSPGLPMQRQGESVTFAPDGRALLYGTEGVRSKVSRVALSGDQLPDSVAKDESGTAAGAGAGAGDRTEAGTGRSAGGSDRTIAVGAATLAVLAVIWFGGRRLLRRR
ncbi:hypothetical protein [Streptomyces sp. URMC 123]|uniref:hypothetical protein n=1 Tax=Streptomyces sp. URMC 123 TaxID=3423403 RepID=UPI003F1C0707